MLAGRRPGKANLGSGLSGGGLQFAVRECTPGLLLNTRQRTDFHACLMRAASGGSLMRQSTNDFRTGLWTGVCGKTWTLNFGLDIPCTVNYDL